MIWPHHERAVEKWVEAIRPNPEFLAVIFAGSLTKGYGSESSDIDGFVVVTADEYQRRQAAGDFFYWNPEICDYEGGYVDAKYIDVEFIRRVAERGSEPARSAFQGAQVRWSRIDGLSELCDRAAAYPEVGVDERISRFRAQMLFGQWFTGEAAKRDNPYLAHLAANKVILFGARMILAENRILYPYHKWLLKALSQVPDLPADLLEDIDRLARTATPACADAVVNTILAYRNWPEAANRWPNDVMRDSELNWLDHEPPIEDL